MTTSSPNASTKGWKIESLREPAALARGWERFGREAAAGAFQKKVWLDSWYAAFQNDPAIEPRVLVARRYDDAQLAVVLPLIIRNQQGLRIAEFADCNLTDYNAPLLGPAAPRDAAGAEQLWRRLLIAGLSNVDLVQLKKMPMAIGHRPNPLALLPRVTPCLLNGNIVVTGDDYDAWRFTLERTVRKEMERSWRVFTRNPGATFCRITDVAEGQQLLAVMERQQSLRMSMLGQDYTLDSDTADAFYRQLLVNGLGSGDVVLTALTCGEQVVAALLGIRDGNHYVMIRISHAGPEWSNCSPGRLMIERTMAMLHADGCRRFDFSIGNYDYKRRFGVVSIPLVDKVAPLSWRALPSAAKAEAALMLRRYPTIDRHARRWLLPQRRMTS